MAGDEPAGEIRLYLIGDAPNVFFYAASDPLAVAPLHRQRFPDAADWLEFTELQEADARDIAIDGRTLLEWFQATRFPPGAKAVPVLETDR